MIKSLIKGTALGGALALTAGCATAIERTGQGVNVPEKPNFVFILVDDLGWTDVGCFGSTFYETPHIDELCRTGMKFTNAYAACPVCSPTRASIMSGKYPARIDTTDYFGAPQPHHAKKSKHWLKKPLFPAKYVEVLPLAEKTLPETLKENGYNTFFAGKWHLGHSEKHWPKNQGFDVNIGGWSAGGPYRGKKYFSPYDNPQMENGPDGEHLPDRLATETCKFIEKHKDGQFLTYLSFYSVHTPLIARPDLVKKYQEKKKSLGLEAAWKQDGDRKARQVQEHAVYAGMVEAMDLAVGKVMSCLKKNGLDKNTVVVFMSDNGGLSTSEGSPTSNLPLRGGKGWMYEGGIREPMIIRWPGVTVNSGTCHEPVTSTDFYPTMLEMAGIPQMPEQHVDGKSLAPLLKGEDMKRGDIFWHYPHWGNQGGTPSCAIRNGDWKLIEFFTDNRLELYNLKTDIGEHNNLAKKYPKQAKEMHARLAKWRKEVDAKMPERNPKFAK